MDSDLLYRINAGAGFLLTISMTALWVLMVILWPRTRLNLLALWFMFWCSAVMWRWSAAVAKPDIFSINDSLLPTVIFTIAAISTLIFAAVAWIEHVQDARKHH